MMPPATHITTVLRQHLPETLIILGGKHVSVIPEDIYDAPQPVFDLSVIGEGEETLLEIVQQLEHHGSKRAFLADVAGMEAIRGIAFQRDGRMPLCITTGAQFGPG